MRLTLVAAIDEAMAIGLRNGMPWHLPADLRRFRLLTTGHTVLMGRLTWESIGRPLPNRRNVVVSSADASTFPEGVEVFASIDAALADLVDTDEVFVIGGAQIYGATLSRADRLVLTVIHTRVTEADTYFPAFDLGAFDILAREDFAADEKNAWPQTVFDLRRRAEPGARDVCEAGRLSPVLLSAATPG
jgi:dihydrofolate reductase